MSLLELRGVTRSVPLPEGERLTILSGIDLTVDAGQSISIVGRSGSGKSTLLNIVGMLDNPTEGTYHFDGQDIARLSQPKRDHLRGSSIGFIFQQFNLIAGRTALENVAMPLMYARGREFWMRRKLAAEVLDRVGLGHRLDSLPSKLSGGEQQRVAIARALVRRPRLILADEPTGALDLETGEQVMALLNEIVVEEGSTLVTITHDPAIAARAERHFRLITGHLEESHEGGPVMRDERESGAVLPGRAAKTASPLALAAAPSETVATATSEAGDRA